MIRLAPVLLLWFQSVCPLMLSHNTYRLTWVSLTWTWGISSRLLQQSAATAPYLGRGFSSWLPLLTLNVEQLLSALLHPRSHHSLDVGLLLSATAPDLGQDGRRGEFTFRFNSCSCQRCSEGSHTACVHQEPGPPQSLRQNLFEYLLWRCSSAVVCHMDRGSEGVYGIIPFGGGCH